MICCVLMKNNSIMHSHELFHSHKFCINLRFWVPKKLYTFLDLVIYFSEEKKTPACIHHYPPII